MKLRTALAAGIAFACSVIAPASAEPVSGYFQVGRLFNDASWYVDAGTLVGAMSIIEAELGPDSDRYTDGYDGGWILNVNGSVYSPPSYDLTGTTVTGSAVSLSGVNVSMQYHFVPMSSVARILVTLQNPGTATASPTLRFNTNLGSDGATVVQSTSSGDATVTTADRWIVSTQNSSPRFPDPIITTVTHGPGAPRVTPSRSELFTPGSDQVTTEFVVPVPAGQTRSVMLFAGLGGITVADNLVPSAQAGVALFNSTSTLRPEWLSGLSATQQSQIVNWSFFTTCAAEGYTGSKLTLCRSVCETTQSSATLTNKIKLYTAIYRETPPCGL